MLVLHILQDPSMPYYDDTTIPSYVTSPNSCSLKEILCVLLNFELRPRLRIEAEFEAASSTEVSKGLRYGGCRSCKILNSKLTW